jgi:5'-nucleotidase
MLILLTNDDGYASAGLTALARTLRPLGDVWIVAPSRPQNAVGRALTLFAPLKVTRFQHNGYMVDGTPSDCVNIALSGLLPETPALVVSGINMGPNMGDDISYSGTVAAAFEAAIHGIPACALSLACRQDFSFDPAADFAAFVARKILERGLPPHALLNINIPDTHGGPLPAWEITRQGRCRYGSTVPAFTDPRGSDYYWIGGTDVGFHHIEGSDADAIARGRISITLLTTDLTNHGALSAVHELMA